ncbi:MAG: acylneuraminate cytidylyltransferase family protein [Saprospiraceae bacterium]
MKILALIPARGGSKGVPNKNRKLLGGKPLLHYSIETALACSEISETLVSTDDENIAELARAAGANVPFLRPAQLATDRSPTIDTVLHAVQFLQAQGKVFDAVCLLQPTVPFRRLADLQTAIQTFANSAADSLVSVREVPHQFNPHWVFEAAQASGFLKIATGETEIIPRRQELPRAYYRDGSIYLVKTEILLKTNSLYGEKIAYHLSTNPRHVNIDTLEDWEMAEEIVNKAI